MQTNWVCSSEAQRFCKMTLTRDLSHWLWLESTRIILWKTSLESRRVTIFLNVTQVESESPKIVSNHWLESRYHCLFVNRVPVHDSWCLGPLWKQTTYLSASEYMIWVHKAFIPTNVTHLCRKYFKGSPKMWGSKAKLRSPSLKRTTDDCSTQLEYAMVYSHLDRKNINMLWRQHFSIWMKQF